MPHHAMRRRRIFVTLFVLTLVGCDPDSCNNGSGGDVDVSGLDVSGLDVPPDTAGLDAPAGDVPMGDVLTPGDVSPPAVEIPPFGPLYVGAFALLPVTVPPAVGYGFDELTFEVAEGPAGGLAVENRGPEFDAASPTVMFLAGWRPGDYTLQAKKGGAVVAEQMFQVTLDWTDVNQGPPVWFEGVTEVGAPHASSAWGDDEVTGIQNYNTTPQSGNRHLAIIFVDFADARYSSDAAVVQGYKANWMDHVVNGVNVGGEVRSSAAYWDEVSGGDLSITAEAIGPIEMDGNFADYFSPGWGENLVQPVITKTIAEVGTDFDTVDTIVLVTPTWVLTVPAPCAPTNGGTEICDGLDNDCDGDVDALDSDIAQCEADPQCGDGVVDAGEECDDGNTEKWDACDQKCRIKTQHFAWPQGGGGGPFTIAGNGKKNFGLLSMPNDWTALDGSSRPIYATVTHEIGHSLGLPDLYTPSVPGRNVGGWGLMDWEKELPHISLSERLALGWVEADSIFPFNPSVDTDETVMVNPVGQITPDAGDYIGVEVRVTAGWNYYWEYRLREPGHIGDFGPTIPQTDPGKLLGTDRVASAADAPIARPNVLLVSVLPGSDGPALDVGQTFSQDDPPAAELRLELVSGDAAEAEVHIQFGTFRPDPSIRPWNPPPYQSPDIEVENEKTLADPAAWGNLPWAGNPNTLIARVHNDGNDDAPGVAVQFYVKDFTVGGGVGTYVNTVVEDVPAGATVPFRCEGCWTPPVTDNPHYCVEARIQLYQNPTDPTVIEMTELNNIAQSNYDKYWTESASPSTRVTQDVHVRNPFDRETIILLTATQTSADYRTYLGARWLRLGAGEDKTFRVMYEYARNFENDVREQREVPSNFVHVSGWAYDPDVDFEDEPNATPLGGATVEVAAAYKTVHRPLQVRQDDQQRLAIVGKVLRGTIDDGQPVPVGRVLLRVEYDGEPVPRYATADLDGAGNFTVEGEPGPWTRIEVSYLGRFPYAPSDAEPLVAAP